MGEWAGSGRTSVRRAAALLLLLAAGCGGGGRRAGATGDPVGGAFSPSPDSYALAEAAGLVQAELVDDALPAQVDLRRDGVVPPIQNQIWNSCVGWSLGYFLMTGLEARHYRDQGFQLDLLDPENWFSPDYLYSQRELTQADLARFPHLKDAPLCFERDDRIGCMRPEAAIEALMQHGCCRWPCLCAPVEGLGYRACDESPDAAGAADSVSPWYLAEACGFWYRPRCYVRFGRLRDDNLQGGAVRQLQSWLHAQGTPIAVVVRMREGWMGYRGGPRVEVPVHVHGRPDGLTESRGVCLDAGGRDLGSQHMMTIIGYDRDFPPEAVYPYAPGAPRGSFLFANQWGEKWGQRGTMWLPVAELQKIWVAGYGLIRWDWKGAFPGSAIVCSQGDDGQWIEVSCDGDDVPKALVKDDEACPDAVQVCARHVDFVLAPLPWTGDEARSGPTSVGGTPDCPSPSGVLDTADWFDLGVLPAGTRLVARLEPVAGAPVPLPLERVLEVRITDENLQDIRTIPLVSGVAEGTLCSAGRCLVKVQPNVADSYRELPGQDPRVDYEVVVTRTSGAPCPPGALPEGVIGDGPALRTHIFDEQTLPGADPGARRFHWFDASYAASTQQWGRLKARISISGLAPGTQLEAAVGGFLAPSYHPIDVVTVDEEGATWVVEDTTVGIPEHEASKILVLTRSLTPGQDVAYTLAISLFPEGGANAHVQDDGSHPTDVQVGATLPAAVGPAALFHGWWEDRPTPGAPPPADAYRVSVERPPGSVPWPLRTDALGWRDQILEIRHARPGVTIELSGPGGAALPPGVVLQEVQDARGRTLGVPGVLYRRLHLPPEHRGDVFCVLRDGAGAPLRNFRLRTRLNPTLATWPMVEGPLQPEGGGARDENNAPSSALPLVLGVPHQDTIGFFSEGGLYSWDLWDYYAFQNDDVDRFVDIVVDKADVPPRPDGTAAGLLVRWWDGSVETIHHQDEATSHAAHLVHVAPGERKMIMIYSGTQAATGYTIQIVPHGP